MVYFILVFILLLLVYHFDYQGHKKRRTEWYIVICIYLIAIAGLRYRIGNDSVSLEQKYYLQPDLYEYFTGFDFNDSRYGRGFLLLSAICKSISPSFVVLQFAHAIFITPIIFYFFYKNTKHIFLAALLYFLGCYTLFTFEIMRESCAVAVGCIAWQYFKTNKLFKYYFCAIIAILFHPSGSILLILPIFNLPIFKPFFRPGLWLWIGLFTFTIVAAYLSVKFFDLIRLIQISQVEDYANGYENSKFGGATTLSLNGTIFFFFRSFLYPALAIWILNSKKRKSSESVNIEYLVCWFMYMTIASFFIDILSRFNNYFWPYVILAVSNVSFTQIKLKFNPNLRNLSFGLWMCILLPYMSLLAYGQCSKDNLTGIRFYHRYYPYNSIIFPERDEVRETLFRSRGL
ncbi:MAG: EpsG family protein [Bacteroides sp.]|nr:EpsG family protein [Bacteroides sp.]